MTQDTVKENKNNSSRKIVLLTLLIMLLLVVAWHVLLPILGITIALTASIWGIAIATIVLICVATLLFFIFTGIGAIVLGVFVLAWSILAIVLFPLLFPILIPVLLLMLVIALLTRNKNK